MPKIILLLCFAFWAYAQERLIPLSPAINEIVFALGAGDEVVGTTTYSTYPKAAQSLPKVGGYFSPDLEKIVALRPSLVLMQPNNRPLAKRLEQLGIETMLIRIDRLPHIIEAIDAIGKRVHHPQEAAKITRAITEALEQTKGIITGKRILIVFGYYPKISGNIFVAGQNLYFDDIINASGNTNALHSTRKGQPVLNRENIIALNPDIVIILAHNLEQRHIIKKQVIAPWHTLPITATQKNNIYLIDKAYSGIPSDRLVLFLRDFKEILHAIADQ